MSKKDKPKRSMADAAQSQQKYEEKAQDNFALAKPEPAPKVAPPPSSSHRISPQISCTLLPEDLELLREITVYAITKAGKGLPQSKIIRSMIRYCHTRKEELEF